MCVLLDVNDTPAPAIILETLITFESIYQTTKIIFFHSVHCLVCKQWPKRIYSALIIKYISLYFHYIMFMSPSRAILLPSNSP